MSAFNVVRFRVKPGRERDFIDFHRKAADPGFGGFKQGALVKTGDRTFCMIGEWQSFQKIAAARPKMIAMLDGMRDMLEDLGGGLGVTDPVSGDTIVTFKPRKRPTVKKAAKKKSAKKAKRKR